MAILELSRAFDVRVLVPAVMLTNDVAVVKDQLMQLFHGLSQCGIVT